MPTLRAAITRVHQMPVCRRHRCRTNPLSQPGTCLLCLYRVYLDFKQEIIPANVILHDHRRESGNRVILQVLVGQLVEALLEAYYLLLLRRVAALCGSVECLARFSASLGE